MTFILPGGLGQLFATGAFSALNPANKSANLVLSNNNLTATAGGATSSSGCARGTVSRNSGKRYFEFKMDTIDVAANVKQGVGVCNTTFAVATATNVGVDANSWGIIASSVWASLTNNTAGAVDGVPADNDILQVAVDFTGTKIYLGINNSWLAAGGAFNAATPDYTIAVGTTLFPVCSVVNNGSAPLPAETFNPGSSAFAFTPPTGFTAWG